MNTSWNSQVVQFELMQCYPSKILFPMMLENVFEDQATMNLSGKVTRCNCSNSQSCKHSISYSSKALTSLSEGLPFVKTTLQKLGYWKLLSTTLFEHSHFIFQLDFSLPFSTLETIKKTFTFPDTILDFVSIFLTSFVSRKRRFQLCLIQLMRQSRSKRQMESGKAIVLESVLWVHLWDAVEGVLQSLLTPWTSCNPMGMHALLVISGTASKSVFFVSYHCSCMPGELEDRPLIPSPNLCWILQR